MASQSVSSSLYQPLIERLVPIERPVLRLPLQVALGVLMLAALAQVRVDLGAVPVTGQTLGVLLLGAAYGTGRAGVTVLAYLLAGGVGLSVFSGWGAGWSTLAGTTGGYLVGFLLAATAVGYLAERGWDRSYGRMAAAMVIGNLIIYLCGLLWLRPFAPDLATTLQWGLWPFLVGDVIKVAFAVALLPTVWRALGRTTSA